MKQFKLSIITPEATIYDNFVNEVVLPTKMGEIGVLAGHENLVTILEPGEICIKKEDENTEIATLGGFVEIANGNVKVLSDSAVRSEAIDAIKAEEAKRKAEQILQNAQDDIEIADASASLEKALLHIKIANRKKRHRL